MGLYLVDSSIFIYRAWFAPVAQQLNIENQPNQALIGFTDFVYRLLSERAPAKLVFAFDRSQQQSSRKALFPEYKANRNPTPDELKRQFSWCEQWVEQLGISSVSSTEWEADDLIGTLAGLHRSENIPIVILTADKDLAQLVRQGDLWWSFYDDKKFDYRALSKKFGVIPEQIADQLALAGDKADNIPGIPGVGMKTAAKLLRKYGDIDNLRNNLDLVGKMKFRYAGKIQKSLIENESVLDVSSQLTRINCTVAGMQEICIERSPVNAGALREMMRYHNMDRFRRQQWESFLQPTQ